MVYSLSFSELRLHLRLHSVSFTTVAFLQTTFQNPDLRIRVFRRFRSRTELCFCAITIIFNSFPTAESELLVDQFKHMGWKIENKY